MSGEIEPKPIHPKDKDLFAKMDSVADETDEMIRRFTTYVEQADIEPAALPLEDFVSLRPQTSTIPQVGITAVNVTSRLL